jgi:hypothetical protein
MAVKARKLKRSDELGTKKGVEEKLLDVLKDVRKGFEDQYDRVDEIMDNWDLYNCKLDSGRQFYNGNSQIFMPYVHDAVEARVTRFVNQMFPQNKRNVEAISNADGELPSEITALLEHYVRRAKLRTQIAPALVRNGDVEGQYTLYVGWRETKRRTVRKVQQPIATDGVEHDDLDKVDDREEEDVYDAIPDVEVIADADFLVLPATANSLEEALASGGSATVIRRWSKAKIKKLIKDGDIIDDRGEALIDAMDSVAKGLSENRDTTKANAKAAGIRAGGKVAEVYETWRILEHQGERFLCRIYLGGENIVLGCKQNPYWNDRVPVISAPVRKIAGVFKGMPLVSQVSDLQILANDTVNEGADTAHFSAMPIVMTDPLSNPRVDTMVLGLAAVWMANPQTTQFAQFPDLWRSAMDRAEAIKAQVFQTLGVNPSMVPQSTGGAKKRNQAEIANEQQVDIITTADAVTVMEEGILTPLVSRFAEYDHQFRDEALTVRVYGELGLRAQMREIEPIQFDTRYEFRWFGVEAARNAAAVQQKIAAMNVLKGIPPQMYPDYELDLAPVIVQLVEDSFGARLGGQVFKRKLVMTVDPFVENDMLEHGFHTPTHPGDDDAMHMQVHMGLMQHLGGDPHGTIRDHMAKHQAQMQAKAQAAQMQQQGGPPGVPGTPGGAGPGVAGAPGSPPGAMPAGPSGAAKGPPGMIHPDQMARAGAPGMPRKM